MNPNRDIPLTIIFVIFIAIFLNAGIAFVVVGLAPLNIIYNENPIISAFNYNPGFYLYIAIIGIGLFISLACTCFMWILALPRIMYAMSKDGMLPKIFKSKN